MKRRKFIQLSSKSSIALSALSFHYVLPFISSCFTSDQLNTIHLNEMKDWHIIVSSDAIPNERYAAEEFQRLFKAITSSELKIDTETGDKRAIYIGKSALNQPHSLNFTTSTLGEEGLHIRVDKDKLLIAGGRPRGTLYGVYEFFERYSGVRFLTADHTYVPQNASDISIPLVDFIYVPQFFFRWSYYE